MMNLKDLLKTKKDLNIFKLNETASFIKKMKAKYSDFQANPDAENSHIKFYTLPRPKSDIPIVCNSQEEMYEQMEEACKTMGGYNFCLGMEMDNGKFHVWKRSSQPCQGGEMRKYGVTHDDCTRPDDPRPPDLKHPFPDGKPIAVGTGITLSSLNKSVLFNNESIYARAFGKTDNISFVDNKGFIVKNADLCDPTVFVNFALFLRDGGLKHVEGELLKYFTLPETKILYNYGIKNTGNINLYISNVGSNNLYNTSFINLKNYLKGGIEATQDITGGPLGQRYDYNRPYLITIFKGGDKEVCPNYVLNNFFFKKNESSRVISFKNIIEMKDDIKECLKEAA